MNLRATILLTTIAATLWLSGCTEHYENVNGECVNGTDTSAEIQVSYGSLPLAASSPKSTTAYKFIEDDYGINTCKDDKNKIIAGLVGSSFPATMYSTATDNIDYAGCRYTFAAPHQCDDGTVIAKAVDIPEYDAALSSLTLSSGNLTPGFTRVRNTYTVTVPYDTYAMRLTPTTRANGATVKVNNQTVSSGSQSQNAYLTVGSNQILVEVTSSNGEKTYNYSINVTRSQSSNADLQGIYFPDGGGSTFSPAFNSSILNYSVTLPEGKDKVSIWLDTNLYDSAKVIHAGTPLPYSIYYEYYMLNAYPISMGDNLLSFLVVAPDGVTTKPYTINVIRGHALSTDANLSGLNLNTGSLSPSFSEEVTNYGVTVPNSVPNIQVTPTASESHAAVTVNGYANPSGSASSPIPLVVGSNSIPIIVTAENGTSTKTYTVNITRQSPISSSAYLSNLAPSSGSLTPTFDSRTFEYNLSISGRNYVIFTPTAENPNATIRVNGRITGSGQDSQPIELFANQTIPVEILVYTDNVADTRYYTISVHSDGGF